MDGALSMDWAPMTSSYANMASYVEAATALHREDFASRFMPPPTGSAAVPTTLTTATAPRPAALATAAATPPVSAGPGDATASSRPPSAAAQGVTLGGGTDSPTSRNSAAVHPTGTDPSAAGESSCNGAALQQGSEGLEKRYAGADDGEGGEYIAVAGFAPAGTLRGASLVYDAVELGGRMMAAAGVLEQERGRGMQGRAAVDWVEVAQGVTFEGLSGTVRF